MTTIRITHGSTTHAAGVLALLHESFAEYRGWLKPESGVFSETVVTLAAKFVALRDPLRCTLSSAATQMLTLFNLHS